MVTNAMGNQAAETVNSIIAEALKTAGVAPRNIQLESEPVQPESTKETLGKRSPDGSPKSPSMSQSRDEVEEPKESTTPKSETDESESAKSEEKAAAAITKAEIAAMIDQASSRFQSIMDRKINQITAQMNGTVNALNQFFQSQDEASISNLPEDVQIKKRLEKLEKGGQLPRIQVQQPIEEQPTQFYSQLLSFVDAVGLRADDKRIDWAATETDPKVGFNKFLSSIKVALTEDSVKAIQSVRETGEKEITKIRKKSGVDKVSTTGPSGKGLPDIDKMTPMQKLEYAFQQNEIAAKT
jgi:hypothetical protein